MQGDLRPSASLRRNEALAYITQEIVRTGTSPTASEIGLALKVSRTRAQQLTNELIRAKVLGRRGSGSLYLLDLAQCRHIITEQLRELGLIVAEPMGELQPPLSDCQLPLLPPFEHLPDPD